MTNRWWIYQKERFPLLGHGPLILAFSFCAVSYARHLRGDTSFPPAVAIGVAFVSCILFFLQLRIADEFKDFDEDSRWRPYRPVPRGLIKLRELAIVFILAAATQLIIALLYCPVMALILLLVWIYLAGMSKEFFVRQWLKARPVTYMLSHMLIMPMIDFYATSSDWLAAGVSAPSGLGWFLATSFFNGLSVEIGRKLRSPADEEEGVQTYTVVWGRPLAVFTWLAVLACTMIAALCAADRVHALWPPAAILGTLFVVAIVLALRFLIQQKPRQGKSLELFTGLWTLGVYLSLGLSPLIL